MSGVEAISGNSGGVDRVDAAKAYMEAAYAEEASTAEISNVPSNGISSVSDNAGSESSVSAPPPGEAEVIKEKVLESFEKIDEAIEDAYVDDISQDSDHDGIPDFLDATGSDTLIEQAYDQEAERLAAEKHAFVSMMAMLSNFDLTNFEHTKVNGDPTSLSAIAAAGCAQVALMHSHRLSEASEMRPLGPASLKKLLQDHQKKTADEKRAALQKAGDLLSTLPTDKGELLALLKSCPQIKKLPPAKQQLHIDRMLNNLEVMKRSLITPASAEA